MPRLAGTNALVIVLPLPVKFTFASTVAGRFKVVAVTAPCRSTSVSASVSVTVVAPIAPVNVAVPASRIVNVPTPPILVPVISAPEKCPVSKIKSNPAPVTAPIVRSPVPSTACVSKTIFAPKVIAPKIEIAAPEVTISAFNVVVAPVPSSVTEALSAPVICPLTAIDPPEGFRIVTGSLKVTAVIVAPPLLSERPIVIPLKPFCKYPISVSVN